MGSDARAYLGQRVRVVIDRPLGSYHPRYPDIRYAVNYGFVPDTVGGDGAPIDTYVLGVGEPVQEATGVVIGIVLRLDDDEDKLVVAPHGRRYSAEQIQTLLAFQERFFTSQIVLQPDEGEFDS